MYNTGPTKAYEGHYYMRINSYRGVGRKARFGSPSLSSHGCNILTLAFHAYGSHLGVFKVKKQEEGQLSDEETLWKFSTVIPNYHSLNAWRRVKLHFNASSNYQIIIEATTGTKPNYGDYAFDDFQIEANPSCKQYGPPLAALSVFCDFEEDFCGLQNTDHWFWSRTRYSLISGSGPINSLSTYAYVRSKYQFVGSRARLSTPVIVGSSNCMNLTFHYNARGADLGNFSVIQEFPYDTEPDVILWNRIGPNVDELANYWKEVRLPINSKSKYFKIVFQVRQMHYGAQGDYAIDRVNITSATNTSCNNYSPNSTPYYYSPYTCDFEGDVCGMTTSVSTSNQWKHVSVGDQVSYNFSVRSDGGSSSVYRHFMYLPVSMNQGIPRLLTPVINLRTHCLEITFQCITQSHGYLNVLVINGTSRVIETVPCGYYHGLWSTHTTSFAYPYHTNVQIGFEPNSSRSSIGLDNIKVLGVACMQPATTRNTSYTTPAPIQRFLYSSSGYIQSPNFPWGYYNNMDLYWYIILSYSYSRIFFQFISFHTETSSDCNNDYVRIYNRRHCGSKTGSLTIPGNSVDVYFHTDSGNTRSGFRIFYQGLYTGLTTVPTNTAYSQIMYSDSGTLMSPNYPFIYPNNYQYYWYIRPGNVPSQIRFIFVSFNVYTPSAQSCRSTSADYIQITSGIQSTKFCGSKTSFIFTTQGSTATVLFKTNGSIRRTGFIINYVALEGSVTTKRPPTNDGRSSLYNYYGTIRSPYYPNNYRSRYKHTWKVYPYNIPTQIIFNFTYFRTENCSDYVQIFTGNSRIGSRKYCGKETGTIKTIYSSSANVYFYTDSSVTYKGFSISYQTLGGVISTVAPRPTSSSGQQIIRLMPHSTGLIESPQYPNGYPKIKKSIMWNLTGNHEVHSISFKFIDIDLPQHCSDFVTISKNKLCKSNDNKNISVSGRNSTVIFNIDSVGFKIGYYRGFVLRYYAHAKDLGMTAPTKKKDDETNLSPLYIIMGVLGCILLVCGILATLYHMKTIKARYTVSLPVNYDNQEHVAHVDPPPARPPVRPPVVEEEDEEDEDYTPWYNPATGNNVPSAPLYPTGGDEQSPPSYDTLSHHGSRMFPNQVQRHVHLQPLSTASRTPLDSQPNTGKKAPLPPIYVTPRTDGGPTAPPPEAPPPPIGWNTTTTPQLDTAFDI